jgi:hypothetical protein
MRFRRDTGVPPEEEWIGAWFIVAAVEAQDSRISVEKRIG